MRYKEERVAYDFRYSTPTEGVGVVFNDFSGQAREIVCGCGKKFTTHSGNKVMKIRCPECRVARRKVIATRANAKRKIERDRARQMKVLVRKSGFGR